jgi:hypothetical protein
MKSSSDSYTDSEDREALLSGADESHLRRRNSRARSCLDDGIKVVWSCIIALTGVLVGLMTGYGLFRPSATDCVRLSTYTSECNSTDPRE